MCDLVVEGARKVDHLSLLYCHSLCSILGAVERDFVPSVSVHLEHQVTTDHEHQPELDILVWIIIINTQVSIHVA